MRLLVGLGNPGQRYAGNRHNIGFMIVDAIARRHAFSAWRPRFHGLTAEGKVGREHVLLLKPETYMNDSGRAVAAAMHFYKLGAGNVAVVQDEIELPPGKVRVKVGGTTAGHNGIRSIEQYIGNEFRRVRIGVGRPAARRDVEHYVLENFAKAERDWVTAVCETIADNFDLIIKGEDASFQNKVHLAMRAKGFVEPDKKRRDGSRPTGLQGWLKHPGWLSIEQPLPRRAELYESRYDRPGFLRH
jgi:PTH1 family peptidyl-tRNA hydrolase